MESSRFSYRLLAGCLAACLGLAACAATPLPESTGEIHSATTQADWSTFHLGPNDMLYMSVFGLPEFQSPEKGLRVAPDGSLSVHLLGDVPVAGKTAKEARELIREGLSKYYPDPSVSLTVLTYASRRFFVLGDVNTPGPVSMDRPVTALEGLSMGGGVLIGANSKQVSILRLHPDDEVEVIRFDARAPGLDGFVQLQPDDLIFVGKAGVGVFTEKVLPYLQGIGQTFAQGAALALALDRL